jgi:cytochrome c551/c552
MRLLSVFAFVLVFSHAAAPESRGLPAGQIMSPSAQNALVQKYCATCHTDATRTGGVSFEHFHAVTVPPSLAAMMLSKVRSGAMGAAAIPMPDKPTIDAFAAALATEAKGAEEWTVESNGTLTTASVLRELRAPSKPGGVSLYRLALTCDAATGSGEMQLSWSPLPVKTTLNVQIGTKPFTFNVNGADFRGLPRLVSEQLVFSGLFSGETVQFSFDGLPKPTRRQLAPCFKD